MATVVSRRCTFHQDRYFAERCTDAAYRIAQSVGKSAELCLSNSSFQLAYESCKNCTEGNTKSDGNSTQEDQLPQFSPYLDFCGNFSEGSLTVAPTSTPTDCLGCSVISTTDYKGRTVLYTQGPQSISETLECEIHGYECLEH